MVWQHKPSGYTLTGKIPCTSSDNISHCVQSTAPLFTPTEQSYPAFLFQIPPFFSQGGDFLSFPFLRALRWCHPQQVSIAPNSPVNLGHCALLHTHFCLKKEKRGGGSWPLAPEIRRMEATLSDNADLSPVALLSSRSRLGLWEKNGVQLFTFCRQVRWCVEEKAALCQGWTFVFDMNFIILFWPRLLAVEHLSFPLTERLSFGKHYQHIDETMERVWKQFRWGFFNTLDQIWECRIWFVSLVVSLNKDTFIF